MAKKASRTIPKIKPKNYQQVIAESLTSKGFQLNANKVRNVLRGITGDVDLQILVWSELRKVCKKHERKLARLERLKGLKKVH